MTKPSAGPDPGVVFRLSSKRVRLFPPRARSAHLPTTMGCAASKKAVDPGPPGPGPRPAKPLAPLTPEAQAAAQERTVRLLESLAAKEELVKRPVL